jgi:hypothetical protein
MHNRATILFALSILTLPTAAAAQARVRGLASIGAEMGGDKVLQFTYDDGSTPDVPAGSGLLLSGGVVIDAARTPRYSVEAQLTAGLKFRTIPPATNQDATWLRFPLEGLVFLKLPEFRLGGGVTTHLANTLKASGAVLNDEVTFKPGAGFILQAGYLRKDFGFDVRYTALDYEVDRGGSGTLNASSLGVGMTYFFRSKRRG